MKTWSAKKDEVPRKWWVVDASDQTLGRLATEVAMVVQGKKQPTYTPHTETGDFVVVVNSEKIRLSGRKWDLKKYYRHSRFFGSLKETTAKELLAKDSPQIIRSAIKGMLPRNKMATSLLNKVKIYEGGDHPHQAQKPAALTIPSRDS